MTLRRMVVLSLVFHGVLFLTLILSSLAWPRKYIMPLIHQVELVRLPAEPVSQPKPVAEPRPRPLEPKPVEQKPKVKEQKPLEVKKAPKAVQRPPEQKKTEMKGTVVTEKPPVLEESKQADSAQEVQEASTLTPGIPEIRPLLEKADSAFAFYHALIGREIRKRWLPPPVSYENQRMEAIVSFSISRSGRINSGVKLEKSSGNPFYDQAALRATLGPLPPPPPGYPEELLDMRLIYVLDQSRIN